jgi:hypothetical protein
MKPQKIPFRITLCNGGSNCKKLLQLARPDYGIERFDCCVGANITGVKPDTYIN